VANPESGDREFLPCVPASDTRPAVEADPELPDYLVRHYAKAYLWPSAVWFFDHQAIINAILFGQYRAIMAAVLGLIDAEPAGRTLQITAVYGELTPQLAERIPDLHLIDVAEVQLQATRRKLAASGGRVQMQRMNCEQLAYPAGSFDTALMFMLLHELPSAARRHSLREAIRVLTPGGRLVIAEYGELGTSHLFHRLAPMRRLLEFAEPFLGGFWREDLAGSLAEYCREAGRSLHCEAKLEIFGGFYRALAFRIT